MVKDWSPGRCFWEVEESLKGGTLWEVFKVIKGLPLEGTMGPSSPPHSLLLPSHKVRASAPPPAPTKICCPATGPKAVGPTTTDRSPQPRAI